jgi:hypothetical protein
MTVNPSCSTSLPTVNSLTQVKGGYTAGMIVALDLEVVSYVQVANHLMVMESVNHVQITMVIILDV